MIDRRFVHAVKGALLGLAVIGATACASGSAQSPFDGEGDDVPDGGAAIVIDNQATRYSDLTIYIVPESGARRRLGTVRLNERATFTVPPLGWGGDFRLLADPLGEREIVSRRFILDRGDLVEWNLSLNNITHRR